MKYLGSKNRIAKYLLPIILKDRKEGHQVFISEYNAPEDFECIWEGKITQKMNNNKKEASISTEKLFRYKGEIKIKV